jgi:S-disulfanyl-L-cysteine oxidoreductase SoxD
MCRLDAALAIAVLLGTSVSTAATPWQTFGTAASPEQISSWDIDVLPDGQGLPSGRGSVAEGEIVYEAQCASCHGTFGESTDYIAIAGGVGSLASSAPQRTVGSKLNYATTLWDYIYRAMPFNNSKTLSANDVYAVTAYVLSLNDIVPGDAILDQTTLPKIVMPNRDGYNNAHGFTAIEGRPDVENIACMSECTTANVVVQSHLPDGFAEQMYGDLSSHFRTFGKPPVSEVADEGLKMAQKNGCLACHAIDTARVGPPLAAVATRYADDTSAETVLATRVQTGSTGNWGAVPMPPQRHVDDEDLATIIHWILAGARSHEK